MCPSSWKLYVDDFPFFWFLSSLSRTWAKADPSWETDPYVNYLGPNSQPKNHEKLTVRRGDTNMGNNHVFAKSKYPLRVLLEVVSSSRKTGWCVTKWGTEIYPRGNTNANKKTKTKTKYKNTKIQKINHTKILKCKNSKIQKYKYTKKTKTQKKVFFPS
jgi:hypothetical protein